ncbi:MAG: hypothetical protein ABDH29_03195 [Aquificaceae bacterium]
MKVSELGEFGFIERIKKILESGVIGDDTAPIRVGDRTLLLTCDVLLQDRHFKLSYPPTAIGWKVISVNVSGPGGKWWHAYLATRLSLVLPDIGTGIYGGALPWYEKSL